MASQAFTMYSETDASFSQEEMSRLFSQSHLHCRSCCQSWATAMVSAMVFSVGVDTTKPLIQDVSLFH